MTVSGLFVYPVKSLRGYAVERSAVGPQGLRWDRRWMIVDEEGRFRTQRQIARMTTVSTFVGESLVLSADGQGAVEVPLEPQGATIEGTVWNWTGPVDLVDPAADRWLSGTLEMPCRLVAMRDDAVRTGWGEAPIAFPDGGAVLVAGEASLHDLNGKLEEPAPMDRFRANVVLAHTEPYAEDEWTAFEAGDVALRFAKRCGRCLVTTTDQTTGERHAGEEPLRTLVRERTFGKAACFGSFYAPEKAGEIAVGYPIKVR